MPDANRVLFLSPQPFFEWRGSPIRVGFDVQALAELGFEVDLLTMPVGQNRDIPGVRVLRVPNLLGVRALPIGPSPAKAVLDLALGVQALRLAGRRKYAVVHGVEEAGAIALAAARRCGARVVFEKHSDPGSHRQGALRNAVLSVYGCVERHSIRRAAAVICTGEGLARQARATGTRAAVYCIPDIPSSLVGADPAQVQAMRARFCSAPDEVLAMYVGSFAVYQGIDLMFDALPRVAAAHPGVRFVIFGGTAAEIETRRRRLTAQGCAGAVTFAGFIAPDELPHALAAADILLSPRLSGVNTPLKLLDYLKAGAAIAAVDAPANRLILDERTAVLTAPDAAAFAAGILRLAGDGALRRRLGAAGRSLQETAFSYAVFKRGLAACYAGLGEQGPWRSVNGERQSAIG
jgi:glycosyltransferase involved in cell wall biosynthesis